MQGGDQLLERIMHPSEREYLDNLLKNAPSSYKRFTQGVENALVLFASTLLAFFVAWAALAWLVRFVAGFDFGWKSPAAPWLMLIGIFACLLLAVVSSVRWIRGWRDMRPLLKADLDGGQVIEEHHHFNAAKRFQEQEHGGLLYFLRTTEDKVLVLYDHESQDLGVDGGNPLTSSFQPRTEFVMVRAPHTRQVISQEFTGAPLDAGELLDLLVPPEQWPDSEEWCDIPWDKLESRFSSPSSSGT